MTIVAALPFLIMQRYAALGKADPAEAYKLISAGMSTIPPDMPSHYLPVLSIFLCSCSASSSPKVPLSTLSTAASRAHSRPQGPHADSGSANHHFETSKI